MKKIIVIMLAALLLAGCNSGQEKDNETTTEDVTKTTEGASWEDISEITSTDEETTNLKKDYKDPEIAKIYREVLKCERTFVSVEEGNKEVLLKDYNYYRGETVEELGTMGFFFIDINDDDNYEVVVQTTTFENRPNHVEKVILCYEDGIVYGYRLPEWIHVYGDKVAGWISVDYPGVGTSPFYKGRMRMYIENKSLKLVYIFEEPGSDEEEWLRESNILTENDMVEYVGEKYNEYEYPPQKREDGHDMVDKDIDKYVR